MQKSIVQGQREKLQVLIADKSGYSRTILSDILCAETGIAVSGLAPDLAYLLELLRQKNKTDAVVLDYDLLRGEAIASLKRLNSVAAVPVLLLIPRQFFTLAFIKESIKANVYALVVKPGTGHYINYRSLAQEIVAKVQAVKQITEWDEHQQLRQLQKQLLELPRPEVRGKSAVAETVFVIGASTGGTKAIQAIVKNLSPGLKAAILIAVHLPAGFTQTFAQRLQNLTSLRVLEGKSGLMLEPNKIIVAPGGRNMIVQAVMGDPYNLRVDFTEEAATTPDQPNIDLLMKSVAKSKVKQVVAIILTGMGKDGAAGAGYIRQRGGYVVAQDEQSSAIFGMAKAAIDNGYADEVLPLAEIPHFINNYLAQQLTVCAADDNV